MPSNIRKKYFLIRQTVIVMVVPSRSRIRIFRIESCLTIYVPATETRELSIKEIFFDQLYFVLLHHFYVLSELIFLKISKKVPQMISNFWTMLKSLTLM